MIESSTSVTLWNAIGDVVTTKRCCDLVLRVGIYMTDICFPMVKPTVGLAYSLYLCTQRNNRIVSPIPASSTSEIAMDRALPSPSYKITNFPPEIIKTILFYLSIEQQILVANLVCKDWSRALPLIKKDHQHELCTPNNNFIHREMLKEFPISDRKATSSYNKQLVLSGLISSIAIGTFVLYIVVSYQTVQYFKAFEIDFDSTPMGTLIESVDKCSSFCASLLSSETGNSGDLLQIWKNQNKILRTVSLLVVCAFGVNTVWKCVKKIRENQVKNNCDFKLNFLEKYKLILTK